MHDLKNNVTVLQAIAPAAHTADKASGVIDLQGYKTALFVLNMGTITDGKWGLEITECDTSDGIFTAVDDADLIGAEPTGLETGDGKGGSAAHVVGYRGNKRYLKATLKEEVASTTGAVAGAVVILGGKLHAP